MASANDLALASVIVAGGVGILAPAISVTAAAFQQKRTLKHERARLDLAELRQVIDHALESARRARTALRYHTGAGLPAGLRDFGEAVGLAASRLNLRLGAEHDVAGAYSAVQNALGEWTEAWIGVNELLDAMSGEEEIEAHFQSLEDAFHGRLKDFEAAALDLVGSKID